MYVYLTIGTSTVPVQFKSFIKYSFENPPTPKKNKKNTDNLKGTVSQEKYGVEGIKVGKTRITASPPVTFSDADCINGQPCFGSGSGSDFFLSPDTDRRKTPDRI